MTRPAHHGIINGWLAVTCTCERSMVGATPTEIRNGTPISCGVAACTGRQSETTWHTRHKPAAKSRSVRRVVEREVRTTNARLLRRDGMTHKTIAEILGVAPATVAHYLRPTR